VKVIILAAGQGTRLWKYTRHNPKGMINFLGKPILKHQIDLFSKFGINDITIVKGYQGEKINFPSIKYYYNKEYSSTNMVESLMCASDEFDEECIITYSDILFDETLLEALLSFDENIGVCVDKDFEDYWRMRLGNKYEEDMEGLSIEENKILSIGDSVSHFDKVDGRYVGALKFSKKGLNLLVDYHKKNKSSSPLNSLGNRSFENWHMTDLLQGLIDDNNVINPIIISRGWLEFDTEKDYENYNNWYKEGMIDRFVKI